MLIARVAMAAGLARAAEDSPSPQTTPPALLPPPRESATRAISPRQAMALDAVYRAFFILQATTSQLSLDAYRGGYVLPADKTSSLLSKPDVDDTLGGWIAETVSSLAARGNAYWMNQRGSTGEIINLPILDPLEVRPFKTQNGQKRFGYRGKTYTPRDITHLRLMRLPGEVEGLGPIQAQQRNIGGALDVSAYGSNWFTEGTTPNGTLRTDQALTAEQAIQWREQWESSVRGGRTAVLGAGLAYAPLALKPAELQWLDSQAFSVTQIARMFGMTARQMLAKVEGSSMTYANMEQDSLDWVRNTLMGYLRPIELAVSEILPRGQVARFNLDALLRTDTKTRYEAHQIALNAKFMSRDEVRAIEGLPPMTDTADTPAPATQNENVDA